MSTQAWVRFRQQGQEAFGVLADGHIDVHQGDMFAGATATGRSVALADVELLMPVRPSKVLALWNNYGQLAAKLGLSAPPEPLYFIKSPNSYLDPGGTIRAPAAPLKVVYEGELGIVIGKTAKAVPVEQAMSHVFGYTCANDVTVADILNKDVTFAQWVRAKGFDTFCPMGPAVVTGLDPTTLRVRTRLNGDVRQDYPVSDMRFPVEQLVSMISQDMTLLPGDVILCGTSVGVGSMKPGSDVEIDITGIGTLRNRYE